jgi:hypothetical protein
MQLNIRSTRQAEQETGGSEVKPIANCAIQQVYFCILTAPAGEAARLRLSPARVAT